MNKLYCKNCKWKNLWRKGCWCSIINYPDKDSFCTKNGCITMKQAGGTKFFYEDDHPNKSGDCKYYKKKWYKFWVK